MTSLRILWAFFRKDAGTSTSYRAAYIIGSLAFVMTVFSYFYMARLIGTGNPALARYGGDYFPWVILGMAITEFLAAWLYSLSNGLREAQMSGTLESMMLAPVSPAALLCGMMVWPLLSGGAACIAYLVIAGSLVGLGLGSANWLAAAVIAALTIAAFTGLSLLSAAFVLVFKKGDPITLLFGMTAYFLSGAMFPVELLPTWLRHAGNLLPSTPAIEGIRMALLRGATLAQLSLQWQSLAAMSVVSVSLGIVGLRMALQHTRKRGGFSHY